MIHECSVPLGHREGVILSLPSRDGKGVVLGIGSIVTGTVAGSQAPQAAKALVLRDQAKNM
jgi:hypothetical protein